MFSFCVWNHRFGFSFIFYCWNWTKVCKLTVSSGPCRYLSFVFFEELLLFFEYTVSCLLDFASLFEIEYFRYCPVIPTVLVNGAEGIGTGWSTKVPNYNPRDIVESIKRLIRGEELTPLVCFFLLSFLFWNSGFCSFVLFRSECLLLWLYCRKKKHS